MEVILDVDEGRAGQGRSPELLSIRFDSFRLGRDLGEQLPWLLHSLVQWL